MIDFTEIESGEKFEEFSEQYLKCLGFDILSPSARGPDGGRDLIVGEYFKSEVLKKIIPIRYLVSVKHNAISGKSVGVNEENNICERIKQHNCQGFILITSTTITQSLLDRLQSLEKQEEFFYFVHKSSDISHYLIKSFSSRLEEREIECLFKGYFPKSYERFLQLDQNTTHEFIWNKKKLIVQTCFLYDNWGGKNRFYLRFKFHGEGFAWQIFHPGTMGHSELLYSQDIDGDGEEELICEYACGGHTHVLLLFKFNSQTFELISQLGSDWPEFRLEDKDGDNKYEIYCKQKNYSNFGSYKLEIYKIMQGQYQLAETVDIEFGEH
ncbi:MAG: hypothetical protein Tsb005_20240 [Gammaproteobacteria bacterium]